MGFKFRKSIKVLPGVKVNITKKGISSVSLGTKGTTANIGKKGIRKTVGISGTGLSHSSYQPYRKGKNALRSSNNAPTVETQTSTQSTSGCICPVCSSMVYGMANIGRGMICDNCHKSFTVTDEGIQRFQVARIENIKNRARQTRANKQPRSIKIAKSIAIVILSIIVFFGGFALLLHFMANHGSNSSQKSIHETESGQLSPQAQRTKDYQEKYGNK